MKAIARTRYGDPDVLKLVDLPIPVPNKDELVVQVKYTTVNRTDCGILWGLPWIIRFFTGFPRPSHLIPGTDFSGIVTSVGSEVSGFKEGDAVWGFNDGGLSTQVQYARISMDSPMLKVPEGINFQQAAASPEGAHYAYNFIKLLKLEKGRKVLVNGATGAIGSAAMQFLKFLEADVTAVCGTDQLDLVRSFGITHVIDYKSEDFTQLDMKFDAVLDAVGKSRYRWCKEILKENGTYVSSELGPGWENIFLAMRSGLRKDRRVIFPLPTDLKGSMAFIQERLIDGSFRPMIDRVYPMEEIRDAYGYVRSGKKIGNVLISYE